MKLNALQKVTALVLGGLLVSQAQAQAVDIPASVSGTYTLTYAFASPGSPFTDGTVKTFVLDGAADTMCVDGVSLGTGYFRSGSGSEMLWNGGNGTYYALSLRNDNAFNEINVYSPSDAGSNWKGQFPGPGTYSSAVTCGSGTAPTATLTSDQEYVIGLAAELYPDLFNATRQPVKTAQGYTYVVFNSGVAVGFKDGSLFLTGGPFGTQIKSMGTVSKVTTDLTLAKNRLTVTPTSDMTNLFNLAAQINPLFKNGSSFQTDANGYLYKYFDTGVYAAIKDGVVYVKGGSFGNAYRSAGALNSLLASLQAAINGGNNNNNNGGGTTTSPGLYNLTVSGTIQMSGIVNYTVPFTSVSMAGQVAPLATDTQAIHKTAGAFGAASASGTYSVEVINNTSSRITYRILFSGTYSGLTANYDLTFDYTK